MKVRGPVGTLLAVAGLAVMLLAVNESKAPNPVAEQAAPATTIAPATVPDTAPTTTTPARQDTPPSTAAFPREAVYAGRSSGDELAVAIAVSCGEAAGYLCDGKRIEWWLEGTVDGGEVVLRGGDGARLTGRIDDGAVFGTVSADGKRWPYSAQLAEPPAGLYEGAATVAGQQNRIGWIVLPDGGQVGIRNVSGELSGAPALAVEQGGVRVEGVFVPAERVVGGDDVVGG